MHFRTEAMEVFVDEKVGEKFIVLTGSFLERVLIVDCIPQSFSSFSLTKEGKEMCDDINLQISERLGKEADIILYTFPIPLKKEGDVYHMSQEKLQEVFDAGKQDRAVLDKYIEENNGMFIVSLDANMGMHISCSYSPFITALLINRIINQNKEVARYLTAICLAELEDKLGVNSKVDYNSDNDGTILH